MKKVAMAMLALFNLAIANENSIMEKIIEFENIKTSGMIDFNATKSGDGYDITVSPTDPIYKALLNHNLMHISVDEGPLVTNPHFTLAKAGLSAKGSVFDLLSKEAAKEFKKDYKEDIKYNYEGVISFGGELEDKFTTQPVHIADENKTIDISNILIESKTDLDDFTGESKINLDSIKVVSKSDKSTILLNGIKIQSSITDKPVDNIALFGESKMSVDKMSIKANSPKKSVDIEVQMDANGLSKRVDDKFLNLDLDFAYKALDAKTIATLGGVQKSTIKLQFKNLGIQGVADFVKFSKKMQEFNTKMQEAVQSGNDIKLQKSLIESQEAANELVPIINNTLVKDKSRLVLDWQLKSQKQNHIKADIIYKGEPLQGSNLQGAMISLMAQQLTLIDGSFDIAIERDLIQKVNPLSLLAIDMLKQKGFIGEKDGLYTLKGELKGGKIILNGKTYTLPELAKALFN